MDTVKCKLWVHVGGTLVQEPLKYVGGDVHQWEVEPEHLTMSTFSSMVTAAGYLGMKHFLYVEPGLQFRSGLRVCYDIASFKRLLNHMKVVNVMHVYVEHVERCSNDDEDEDEAHVHAVVEDSLSNCDENSWPGDDDSPGDRLYKTLDDLGFLTGQNLVKRREGTSAAQKALFRKTMYSINDNAPDLCNQECESDCIGTDENAELSVESDGEVVVKRTENSTYDPEVDKVRFELGMLFSDYKQFKHALAKYCIQNHFDIEYEKNNSRKVSAHCKAEFCPFKIVAAMDSRDDTFKIKTFEQDHECSKVFKNTRASYEYLGQEFLPKLRIVPSLTLQAMQDFAKEEMEITVSKTTLARAKNWALEKINGKIGEEFNRLFDYVKELRRVDPEGNFELMVERASPSSSINFRRLYIGFSSLREGFLKCCRPIICLDGCFLKGNWEGELLCAVGRDGNEHIYPISWAVVEKETTDSWGWFLTNLGHDLEIGEGERFTFMTDQQKGLKAEIARLFPRIEHRVCARHLYANWKVKNPGPDLRAAFWSCVKATTQPVYEVALQRLKELKKHSDTQLLRTNPKQWARAFFSSRSTSDAVTNNHAETLNAALKPARGCSILTMLEAIRKYEMDRTWKYMKISSKWQSVFTPTTETVIANNKRIAGKCSVRWNGGEIFEIEIKGIQHVVNLSTWTCSCKKWELTGILCPHAIASIMWKKRNIEDYVSRWFKVQLFKELYNNYPIPGVSSPDFWTRTNIGPIEPPLKQAMPGRKKKNRVKEPGENTLNGGTKLGRAGYKNKCSKYNKPGHNKASCREGKQGSNQVRQSSNNQTPNTNRNGVEQVGTQNPEPVSQTEAVSIPEILQDLYTLYTRRESSSNDMVFETDETNAGSPSQFNIDLHQEETGFTIYQPRQTETRKKSQTKAAISMSQPNPVSQRGIESAMIHSTQPCTSTGQIIDKCSKRGREILNATGLLAQVQQETLNENRRKNKRKANPSKDLVTTSAALKESKKNTKGKDKAHWKY